MTEGEGDKQKITAKAVKDRLKVMAGDPEFADGTAALHACDAQLTQQANLKKAAKTAREALDARLHAKCPKLTEDVIKQLVIHYKWFATLAAAVQSEVERVSQTLARRVRQLAERHGNRGPSLPPRSSARRRRSIHTRSAWASPTERRTTTSCPSQG